MKDKKGKNVVVGSKVRITYIDPEFIKSLPEEEQADVSSMLNEIFEVYEIDEYNHAWVEKEWKRGKESYESHSLALSESDMELIENAS